MTTARERVDAQSEQIELGSLVRVRVGYSALMVVVKISGGSAECVWPGRDGQKSKESWPLPALVKVMDGYWFEDEQEGVDPTTGRTRGIAVWMEHRTGSGKDEDGNYVYVEVERKEWSQDFRSANNNPMALEADPQAGGIDPETLRWNPPTWPGNTWATGGPMPR